MGMRNFMVLSLVYTTMASVAPAAVQERVESPLFVEYRSALLAAIAREKVSKFDEWERSLHLASELLSKDSGATAAAVLTEVANQVKTSDAQREEEGFVHLDEIYHLSYAAMMKRAFDMNDRDQVVKLLSVWCPNRFFFHDLEFSLALQCEGRQWKAPMLLLCDAWETSKSQKTRRGIEMILRRAFVGEPFAFKDDKHLVSSVRNWHRLYFREAVLDRDYDTNVDCRLAWHQPSALYTVKKRGSE